MGHEAEQNLVHSTVHNTNTYKKHINLLSLEGFYYYSFHIIFFPLQISYCIIKKLSSSQAVRWCYKRLCPISQRQSCKLSSAELQSIILSTGFLIKYYFFVYLYAKWIQPGRTFTKDEDIVVFSVAFQDTLNASYYSVCKHRESGYHKQWQRLSRGYLLSEGWQKTSGDRPGNSLTCVCP